MSIEERKLKNAFKKVLKRFPQYKCVGNIDNADIAIFSDDTVADRFYIVLIGPDNKEILRTKPKIFYLKHKNPRNRRQLVGNDVGMHHFMING